MGDEGNDWFSESVFYCGCGFRLDGIFGLLSLILGLIGLAFSGAYLYVGISLRKLLVNSPQLMTNILLASMAYQVITFLPNLGGGFSIGLPIRLAIGFLIIGYLFANIKRLAQEEKLKLEQNQVSD